jgi:hypothetical protein
MVEWHRPDMTPEEVQDYLRRNRVTKEMADKDFGDYIKRYVKENDEILNKLGSDIDEDGVPYWLKAKEEQIKGRDDV